MYPPENVRTFPIPFNNTREMGCTSSAKVAPYNDDGTGPSAFIKGRVTFLLIGLDGAGKTTILNNFKGDLAKEAKKTMGFGSGTTTLNGFEVTFFDIAGAETFRGAWKKYFSRVHGVIWVVDSSSAARLEESRDALAASLADPLLAGKPLLVLANKRDVAGAVDVDPLKQWPALKPIANTSVQSCTARVASNGGVLDGSVSSGVTWLLSTIEGDDLDGRLARVRDDHQVYLDAVAAEDVRRKAEVDAIKAKRAKATAEAGAGNIGALGICLKCNSAPAVKKSKDFAFRPVCAACAESLKAAAKKKAPILCKCCNLRPATIKNKASSWKPCCKECFAAIEAGATLAGAAAAAAAAAAGESGESTAAAPPTEAAAAPAVASAAAPSDANAAPAAADAAAAADPTLVPLGSSFDATKEKLGAAVATGAAAGDAAVTSTA